MSAAHQAMNFCKSAELPLRAPPGICAGVLPPVPSHRLGRAARTCPARARPAPRGLRESPRAVRKRRVSTCDPEQRLRLPFSAVLLCFYATRTRQSMRNHAKAHFDRAKSGRRNLRLIGRLIVRLARFARHHQFPGSTLTLRQCGRTKWCGGADIAVDRAIARVQCLGDLLIGKRGFLARLLEQDSEFFAFLSRRLIAGPNWMLSANASMSAKPHCRQRSSLSSQVNLSKPSLNV
jgi:hypothetical protein